MSSLGIINEILEFLNEAAFLLPRPFETPYSHVKRLRSLDRHRYSKAIYSLKKRGLIKVSKKNNQKFIQLSQKGQLEVLIRQAVFKHKQTWDGKWRLVMFDIPEGSRDMRNKLRNLLKQYGFIKLQASVFINPFPLNRQAIVYLQKSGLIDYLRILRVDEMDNDKVLRRKFHLK